MRPDPHRAPRRQRRGDERLCLHLVQQAWTLGVDLDPAIVDLIQEVMEGRLRARLA